MKSEISKPRPLKGMFVFSMNLLIFLFTIPLAAISVFLSATVSRFRGAMFILSSITSYIRFFWPLFLIANLILVSLNSIIEWIKDRSNNIFFIFFTNLKILLWPTVALISIDLIWRIILSFSG